MTKVSGYSAQGRISGLILCHQCRTYVFSEVSVELFTRKVWPVSIKLGAKPCFDNVQEVAEFHRRDNVDEGHSEERVRADPFWVEVGEPAYSLRTPCRWSVQVDSQFENSHQSCPIATTCLTFSASSISTKSFEIKLPTYAAGSVGLVVSP